MCTCVINCGVLLSAQLVKGVIPKTLALISDRSASPEALTPALMLLHVLLMHEGETRNHVLNSPLLLPAVAGALQDGPARPAAAELLGVILQQVICGCVYGCTPLTDRVGDRDRSGSSGYRPLCLFP